MKRSLFQLIGLFFAVLFVLSLAYWNVSLISNIADFKLSFGSGPLMEVSAANGRIAFCDHFGNLEVVQIVENRDPTFVPMPTGVHGWNIPGFHFRYITFGGNPPVWLVDLSLLIPIVLMLIAAGLCLFIAIGRAELLGFIRRLGGGA